MSETHLVKNTEANRYELHLDDVRVGLIDYVFKGDVVELPHTEVDPAYGGQGFAGLLARFALVDLRDDGLLVNPTCPYIARYIERHSEFAPMDTRENPTSH